MVAGIVPTEREEPKESPTSGNWRLTRFWKERDPTYERNPSVRCAPRQLDEVRVASDTVSNHAQDRWQPLGMADVSGG